MVVVALHFGFRFLEADVIEARKRGAVDVLYGVIGHQEVLFPAHEDVVAALQTVVVEVVRIEGLLEVRPERGEFALRGITKRNTRDFVDSGGFLGWCRTV